MLAEKGPGFASVAGYSNKVRELRMHLRGQIAILFCGLIAGCEVLSHMTT
jgi:hypothetical protein